MKNIGVILVLLLTVNTMYSQDVILKKNGDEIKVKVIEISKNNIKYKDFSSLNGPTRNIYTSEVFMVKYENGTKEVFKKNESPKVNTVSSKSLTESYKNKLNSSFYIGINGGLPIGDIKDFFNFQAGVDFAYLIEVADDIEIGGLVGFSNYFGGEYSYYDEYIYDIDDASFIPVAFSVRYNFLDHKFFGGIDLGYAINISGGAEGGFYYRPKFGYNLEKINLIASYSGISKGFNGNYSSTVDFSSLNIGIEFKF